MPFFERVLMYNCGVATRLLTDVWLKQTALNNECITHFLVFNVQNECLAVLLCLTD